MKDERRLTKLSSSLIKTRLTVFLPAVSNYLIYSLSKDLSTQRYPIHSVSQKKRHLFSIWHNIVRYHPIFPFLPILGRYIPQGIWNKHSMHSTPHLVLYVRTVPCRNCRN